MKKNKWYKSKGGWIGAIVGFVWSAIDGMPSDTLDFIGFNQLFDSVFSPIATYSNHLVFIIGGFLIGYFLEKKLSKKRRR